MVLIGLRDTKEEPETIIPLFLGTPCTLFGNISGSLRNMCWMYTV